MEYINANQDEQAEIYGYHRSRAKTGISWFFIILTFGLLRLVFHWVPVLMLKATHSRCSLAQASKVLVVEYFKKYKRNYVKNIHEIQASSVCLLPKSSGNRLWVCLQDLLYFLTDASYEREYSVLHSGTSNSGAEVGQQLNDFNLPTSLAVPAQDGSIKEMDSVRVFSCKKIIYLWDSETETFYKLPGLDAGQTAESLHRYRGLHWIEQARRRLIFGENTIKVPVTPINQLLFLEALNPFYIFQVKGIFIILSVESLQYEQKVK
nr:polyamine-transporting ATPase 13A3-like isoform X1 [Cherax quadricarinatus]